MTTAETAPLAARAHGGGDRPHACTRGAGARRGDGLLSGVHEPGTSHYRVVSAFGPHAVVDAAHEHAATAGLLVHEFGDATLVMPGVAEAAPAAA